MTIRESIRTAVEKAMREAGAEETAPLFSVKAPEEQEYGDYAANVALVMAKIFSARGGSAFGRKRSPMELARELLEKLADERWEVSVAAPGFVNFKLADSFLVKEGARILEHPEEWGRSNIGESKIVVVEYFQLNIAKRPHIGHLRSAVIGDALKRLLLASGYDAVSDTHVGDWGTQFGILLLAYKDQGGELLRGQMEADPFIFLETLYLEEHKRVDSDPARRDRAKEEFAKLERGDEENHKIWQWMVDISMKKLHESANRLGLLDFDEHRGESDYERDMSKIVELALEKKVAKKTEDGAVIVDLTEEKLDEAVLIKSDSASTYLLRDLATIQYRHNKWNFWKNLYVVDVRQTHHFKQVFRVAELLGFKGVGASDHIEFGFMKLPDGAISTRKGTAISLDAVLDEAEKRAKNVIQEKNSDLKNADTVAKMVGVGAVKYFDLSHNRKSDVVFNWDKALSFEGNTGPYLQYTHARFCSILRKVGSKNAFPESQSLEKGERALLSEVLRLPEAIQDSLGYWSPHVLAGYLYNLASKANEFYHAHPVIQEKDQKKKQLRIALVDLTAVTLKNGLYLLGMEAPEEM